MKNSKTDYTEHFIMGAFDVDELSAHRYAKALAQLLAADQIKNYIEAHEYLFDGSFDINKVPLSELSKMGEELEEQNITDPCDITYDIIRRHFKNRMC